MADLGGLVMQADDQQIPSVWARPHRKQQQALSRDQIVAEAVQLLDTEGLAALSMRRLGTRLDAAATSLYRHVANKDELIELVVDEVYGEIQVPEAGGPAGWRTAAAQSAQSLRAMALRHPWVTAVLGQAGLAYLGPNLMQVSDRMVAIFQTAGFDLVEADRAMSAVIAYVIGVVTSEAAYLSLLARSGQTEQELMDKLGSATEQALESYPRLLEGYIAKRDSGASLAHDENFDYGLDRMLDGLEARLGSA